MQKVTRVLVVDDSAIIRTQLSKELNRDPEIEVVGTAADPYIARDKIVKLKPDVLTLDVEMPKMDGLTFLGKLMKFHPMPVIMVSSYTESGSEAALKAMDMGAVDVMSKPKGSTGSGMGELTIQLIDKVKAAARVNMKTRKSLLQSRPSTITRVSLTKSFAKDRIIAMGASTGGVDAIKEVLIRMPTNAPPIVITQHMPEGFTATFAKRLDQDCALEVREAKNLDVLKPGLALIAPGNHHLTIRKNASGYIAEVKNGPIVCRHRPSVEELFNSAAKQAGKNSIGVIMTGMGKDGAEGLLNMRKAGAKTIAQNKETSVVFGMPQEAIKLDAAESIVPLHKITETILKMV